MFGMRDGSAIIKCYRCGALKPQEEFAWRRKARGQRDSFCRPCRAEYKRKYYLANRERYIGNAHATKRRLRFERTEFLIDYFATHPCFDCGEVDPVVLEFDHLHEKVRHRSGSLPAAVARDSRRD